MVSLIESESEGTTATPFSLSTTLPLHLRLPSRSRPSSPEGGNPFVKLMDRGLKEYTVHNLYLELIRCCKDIQYIPFGTGAQARKNRNKVTMVYKELVTVGKEVVSAEDTKYFNLKGKPIGLDAEASVEYMEKAKEVFDAATMEFAERRLESYNNQRKDEWEKGNKKRKFNFFMLKDLCLTVVSIFNIIDKTKKMYLIGHDN